MQIVINAFNIKEYNLNTVSYYIEQYYKGYKYYSNYFRKLPEGISIFRFYRIDEEDLKKTISVLPAFIFSIFHVYTFQ